MAEYRIVAARPKNAGNHINSQFKLYELDIAKDSWTNIGWQTIGQVCDLMRAGHDVRTGKIVDKRMQSGAAVELELRIAKNDTKFKLSEMPDA